MASNIEINIKQRGNGVDGWAYFTNRKLDVSDDTEINTVVQISDVREPEKRMTDFIQTFKLPATKRNNQAFQHLKEKGFESYAFDPSKKLDCQVIVNGNEYFSGYMQVNSVSLKDGLPLSYEVTVIAPLGSFFNDIADISVRDMIDMSDFDHRYDYYSVAQSWGPIGSDPNIGAYPKPSLPPEPMKTTLFKPGVYHKNILRPFRLGFGYVYPPFFTGQTSVSSSSAPAPITEWLLTDFKPAIYVKTIFDKILESRGIRYSSDFINSEYFRRLIMPSNSEIDGDGSVQLTKQQIENSSVWARYLPDSGIGLTNFQDPFGTGPFYRIARMGTETGKSYGPFTIKFPDDSTAPSTDTGLQYDPASGMIKVSKSGKYDLTVKLDLTLTIRALKFGNPDGGGKASTMCLQGGKEIPCFVAIRNTLGNVVASQTLDFVIPDEAYGSGSSKIGIIMSKEFRVSLKNELLSQGSQYYVTASISTRGSNYKYKTFDDSGAFWWIANSGDYNGTMDLYVNANEVNGTYNAQEGSKMILALSDTGVTEFDIIRMNDFLPNIEALSLIKDLNKMFNLYWKWDSRGYFIIEPHDEFFRNPKQYVIKDWTHKVDASEEQTIEPLFDLSSKTFNFSYSSDETEENQDYEKQYLQVYGSKRVDVESDFVEGETGIELKFAATPLIDYQGTGLIMPSFTKIESSVRKYQKPGPRIMFYGGFQKQINWTLKGIFKNRQLDITHFPYAGHLDNPNFPKFDLNWGICRQYYFRPDRLTVNTLFNQFWGRYIDEMTDRSGHLLTVPLVLSELDMINLDIRDIIQIDDVHYKINKITHNPFNMRAEAELIKAKSITSYKAAPSILSSVAPDWQPDATNVVPKPFPPTPQGLAALPAPTSAVFAAGGWQIPIPAVRNMDIWSSFGTTPNEYLPQERPWQPGSSPFIAPSALTSWPGGASLPPVQWRKSWSDSAPVKIWSPNDSKDIANNNSYSSLSQISVFGKDNIVARTAQFVKIQGTGNIVSEDAKNIQIVGNNNVVLAGVSDAMVVGDGQVVSESGVAIINGMKQPTSGSSAAKVIKSPSDSAGHVAKRISGGQDSSDAPTIISGGQDSSLHEPIFVERNEEILMTPFGPKTA